MSLDNTSMSFGNTSQLGRPVPDELVPSRYALKVGDIDVMVVSDGVLPLPTAMLAHNVDPAVRAAWLDEMFLPPDAIDWALNVVVVRSGDKTILIDAGLGSDPDLHLPRAGQLIKRLEAAGIDLASVTDVVLTHMHMDHVGGLLVEGVKERLRPDLRIHVAAAEIKFWKRPISLASPCRRDPGRASVGCQAVRRTSTTTSCGHSMTSTRWRRAWLSSAPAATPWAQRGAPGVRRRPADLRRRPRIRRRVRTPRVVQWFRTRPRRGGPRPGPSFAGAGGEPRAARGHPPAIPVRLPCGGRRRRLSLRTGRLGLLTACWVSAEREPVRTSESEHEEARMYALFEGDKQIGRPSRRKRKCGKPPSSTGSLSTFQSLITKTASLRRVITLRLSRT